MKARRCDARWSEGHVDLIVLDLMLPGDDGLKLCRELRAHRRFPFLMLTALGEEIERVVGLEVGADDYLPKPFSPRELLGRIKAILRRTVHMPRDPEHTARTSIASATGRSTSRAHVDPHGWFAGGAERRRISFAVDVLAHPTRVLSRPQLMELLRGRDLDPFDRSVDVRISRLRQTLRDDARSPKIIKTVYGEGYLMGLPVEKF